MVEFSPATREARVQFPADAHLVSLYKKILRWPNIKLKLINSLNVTSGNDSTCKTGLNNKIKVSAITANYISYLNSTSNENISSVIFLP